MNWSLLVIIICFLLVVFLIWKEAVRPNKARLLLRIAASLIAVTTLACIALPISYSGEKVINNENQAVLITPGFNPDSLKQYRNRRIFTTEASLHQSIKDSKLLSSLDELDSVKPAIKQLMVTGYGLSENELQQLHHLPVSFHPSALPSGFSSISWNDHLKSGELLRVQGAFANSSGKKVQLVLKGLSTGLDSTTVPANQNQTFELKTIPKATGQVIFNLIAFSDKDTLAKESIPVQIEPSKPLKLLLLAASPDFENKFLKNWLAKNGYALSSRTVISKDKISTEFVNLPQTPLTNLSAAVLDKFDVVIGDLSALKSLKPAEGAALKQEVTEKGIGLIIKADSAGKGSSWLQNNFPLDHLASKAQVATSFNVLEKPGRTSKLTIDPTYINLPSNTQTLITDDQNHAIAGCAISGAGKLVFTTPNTTYNWMLEGNQSDYASVWSLLISKAAKHLHAVERWSVSTPSFINQEANLTLQTPDQPGQLMVDNVKVSPVQSATMPFMQAVSYWPSSCGWHQAKTIGAAISNWYTHSFTEWNRLRAQKTIMDTRRYAELNPASTSVTKQIHQKEQIEVPKIYFYVLLLLTCTFLWAEAKFSE